MEIYMMSSMSMLFAAATGSTVILQALNTRKTKIQAVKILIKAFQSSPTNTLRDAQVSYITYSKTDTNALQLLLLDWYLLNIWWSQSSRCLRPCFNTCLSLCYMSLLGIRENCSLILGQCNTMTYLTRGVGAAPDTLNVTCK